MATFYIKQGDRLPPVVATLQTIAGVAVNLTGGTVKFLMRRRKGLPAVVDAAATITTAADGEVQFDWGAGQTDTPGTYQGEFEFTAADGKKETFPNNGYFAIVITDDVG